MRVIDASVVVLALLNDGESRSILSECSLAVPHLADAEVAHALRAQLIRGVLDERQAIAALGRWQRIGVRRFAGVGQLPRIWELRHNLTPYDATYVALAEALGCDLVTGDARLARAPGPTCAITIVRR